MNKPQISNILKLGLLFLFLAIIWFAYLHHDLSDELNYVTSTKCQQCHDSHYQSWRENTLHPYMFLPINSPDAKILGDFDSNNPIVSFKKEEIEFVVGSKWEQIYVRLIDGEYFPFPAKWYVIQKRWVPYKVKDWHKTPMSYKCNGCHTTGFDPNTLKFAEFGIGCEACHGPGSKHVANKEEKYNPVCQLCHDEQPKRNNNDDIVLSVSPSVCGQCHNRGTTVSGEVIKGTQFNFPAGFKPGDDIRMASFTPSSPNNDKKGKNWWGNGLSKNRHQEFSDWSQSKHSTALINLLESHANEESKRGPLTGKCLHCHSTDYRHADKAKKPSLNEARFGVTCVACHEPHGFDKKLPSYGDKVSVCSSCHILSMAKNTENHIPCSTQEIGCVDCHMPKIVKTGGFFSLRSHAFRIVPPQASIGNKMPNSCQNGGCHKDDKLEKMVNAYNHFYKQ